MIRSMFSAAAALVICSGLGCSVIDRTFHGGGCQSAANCCSSAAMADCSMGGCGLEGCGTGACAYDGSSGGCGPGGCGPGGCGTGGWGEGGTCDPCALGGHPRTTLPGGPLGRLCGGLGGLCGKRCGMCGRRGCRGLCVGEGPNPEIPNAAVAYPYYTVRGPRDFLAKNPGGLSN